MGEWTQDYDAAVELAKKTNATVVLNFTGSDWCGWCKLMDRNVFHHKDFSALAKELNLVLVYIDFPRDDKLVPKEYKDRNKALSTQYGVRGYPTYIILDSQLQKIGKLGAGRDKTPKSFTDEIKERVRLLDANVQKKAKELGDKGDAFLADLQKFNDATAKLEKWIDTRPAHNVENEKKYEALTNTIEKAKAQFFSYY